MKLNNTMDKQTELKAKIGECQLQLEDLQAKANKLSQMKQQFTQSLIQEMNKPVEPTPEVKPVKKK